MTPGPEALSVAAEAEAVERLLLSIEYDDIDGPFIVAGHGWGPVSLYTHKEAIESVLGTGDVHTLATDLARQPNGFELSSRGLILP